MHRNPCSSDPTSPCRRRRVPAWPTRESGSTLTTVVTGQGSLTVLASLLPRTCVWERRVVERWCGWKRRHEVSARLDTLCLWKSTSTSVCVCVCVCVCVWEGGRSILFHTQQNWCQDPKRASEHVYTCALLTRTRGFCQRHQRAGRAWRGTRRPPTPAS
jgi:hypothetical protein